MENSSDLINWAIKNKDFLSLEVTYLTGLNKFFDNIFDISVNMTFSNKKFEGRGTDFNEEIAISKAISECIERIVVFSNPIPHSNGFAVHPALSLAKENAKFELIERDAFLVSFLLKRFNGKTHKILLSDNSEMTSINFQNNQFGFGFTTVLNGINAIVPYGLIWGSSFNSDPDKAELASRIEVLRKYSYILNNDFENLSINDFNNVEVIDFSHHGKLSLNIEYAKKILNEISFSNVSFYENIIDNFIYNELSLDFLNSPPLYCIQATNQYLQDLWVGQTTHTLININRLSSLENRFELDHINKLPHPID